MQDPNQTQMLTADPNRTVLGAPSADPNRTIMGSPTTLNATQTIKPVQCPICKTFNPAGIIFCNECGLLFESALPADAFGAPAVQLPTLVDESGREYVVRPGDNVVGREGDISLVDGRVSRRHAVVTSDKGTLSVTDAGSTNGTEVNGAKLTPGAPQPLAMGDTLSFGGVKLKLSLPGVAAATQNFGGNKTAAISAPPQVEAPVAMLVGTDKSYPLKPGVNTFGRKPDNDVAIVDPYVSGRHGLIDVAEDGVYLTDVNSTNGTVLNDARLTPSMRTKLSSDDVIRLGALEFRVVVNA